MNSIQKKWVEIANETVKSHITSTFRKSEKEALKEIINNKPLDYWVEIASTPINQNHKYTFDLAKKDERDMRDNLLTLIDHFEDIKPGKLNATQLNNLNKSLNNSFSL